MRTPSPIRHIVALILLSGLDAQQDVRTVLKRTFPRFAFGLLTSVLLVMVAFSLWSLSQVTHSVRSMLSDAMVGVEATVGLRAAVREVQISLIQGRLEQDHMVTSEEVAQLRRKFDPLMKKYRSGVFEAEDEANAETIEACAKIYLEKLTPILDKKNPDVELVKQVQKAAIELVNAIDSAHEFNQTRMKENAEEARASAQDAIRISSLLWAGFGAFVVILMGFFFGTRWLALPKETHG